MENREELRAEYLSHRRSSLLNQDKGARYDILRIYFNLMNKQKALSSMEFEICLAYAIEDDQYLHDMINNNYTDIVRALDKYFHLLFLYKTYGEQTIVLGVF